MQSRVVRLCFVMLSVLALAATGAAAAPAAAPAPAPVNLSEFTLASEAMDQLRADFVDQTLSRHKPGTWAPLKMELSDKHLSLMGLPSADVLRRMDFSK